MAVPRVRADYERLAQIASGFAQQAGAARQTLQTLKRQQEILRGGDWIGQGATKFYQEMDADVLPAVTRLASALETAQRIVIQVSQTMKQAEEEAARYLNGQGVGRAPGPAGTGASAGGGAGQATGQAAGPAARLLSGFSDRTRELAAQSPTITTQLEALERQGWTIQQGPAGGGSYADRQTHTLVIDGGDSAEYQVGGIAHEGAHALYGEPPYHPPTATMTREEYIRLNVNEALHDEGNAQFHEVAARQEILDHSGPDIGTSGTQAAEYQRIYGEYRAGNLTREQAIDQMGTAIGNDSTSTTHENYRTYYGHTYEDYWDNHVAPTRNNP